MQLVIEAADDVPGVGLAVDGVIGVMASWETERNHSVELLPNIERLLAEAGRSKRDIEAVLVDVGPGGYAALRVGVSIAKALAHGLGVPIAGVGRLELDAWGVAREAGLRRIVAVHRAGRGDVAWAAYGAGSMVEESGAPDVGSWTERAAPRITKVDVLVAAIERDDVVTGDVDTALAEAVREAGASVATAHAHRVVALAALGAARIASGRADDARTLVPLYLRAPAIGPQS
jgi:tRNA threonylcarbamoyladenosine biosynthesis protein TsaB